MYVKVLEDSFIFPNQKGRVVFVQTPHPENFEHMNLDAELIWFVYFSGNRTNTTVPMGGTYWNVLDIPFYYL